VFSVIGKEITVKVDALPLERFTVLFNNNRYHFPTWTTHFALHENNQWLPVGPSEKLEGIGVPAKDATHEGVYQCKQKLYISVWMFLRKVFNKHWNVK